MRNNNAMIGFDIGVYDHTCYIYGRKLKNGTIKISKVVFIKSPTNNGKERKMSGSTTKNPRISSKLVVS